MAVMQKLDEWQHLYLCNKLHPLCGRFALFGLKMLNLI